MRLILAAVDGGISHATVGRLHVDLGSHTALLATGCAFFHLLPHLEVFLLTVFPVVGLNALLALIFHGLWLGVVNVSLALSHHFLTELKHQIKIA